jgi:predicted dienelactone hydrolase
MMKTIVRKCLSIALPLSLLLLCSCTTENDGVLTDSVRNRDIEYKVWLPETERPAPLVLLSHGSGGHYINLNWLVEPLVEAGYAVAAVVHPHNWTGDDTPEGVMRVWDRPTDLSLLLTYLLESPRWRASIDESRIGAAGFSSGGYTVIALAGAIYELERMQSYCAGENRGPDCDLAPMLTEPEPNASASFKDSRIRAVFSMAPAVGPAITPDSLAAIAVPVSIVATADDELLKPAIGAEYYAQNIPHAGLTLLPKGGHFLFLSCDPLTRVADWFISDFDLCGREIDVDRGALQREISAQAIAFFDQYIGQNIDATEN